MQSCGTGTGYRRDGFCSLHQGDAGRHTVCATLSDEFLAFTRERGNDLRGLQAGDRWCLCESRYEEAESHNVAPAVHPEASAYAALTNAGAR